MIPVDQLIVPWSYPGPPYGDCLRACIASLLELPADAVPHFMDYPDSEGGDRGEQHLREWLASRGIGYLVNFVPLEDLEAVAEHGLYGYHVMIGSGGPKGAQHAVVAYRGRVVHDPHPERPGILPIEPPPEMPGVGHGYYIAVLVLLCGSPPHSAAAT